MPKRSEGFHQLRQGVYFISTGFPPRIYVKIGYTQNIKKRIYNIGTHTPESLNFIGFWQGATLKDEQKLHHAIIWWQKRAEWFDELAAHILLERLDRIIPDVRIFAPLWVDFRKEMNYHHAIKAFNHMEPYLRKLARSETELPFPHYLVSWAGDLIPINQPPPKENWEWLQTANLKSFID